MKKTYYIPLLLMVSILILAQCSKDIIIEIKDETVVNGPYEFKELLSEYNFFEGALAELNPSSTVHKYDLATPLFSDYTIKERFIQFSDNAFMTYNDSGIIGFPPGTIIIKNFSSLDESNNLKRLETRLFVLDPFNDRWKVMSYLWNEEQTEAVEHISGANVDIKVNDEFGNELQTNYRIPNLNECKLCHSTNGRIAPIGPKVRALNYTPNGTSQNQLNKWESMGILKELPTSNVPVLADWLNTTDFTLDERARAYLDVNCAHCHSNAGDASYTGLWLEYEQRDSSHLGFFKTPIAAGTGSGNLSYDIVPGDAEKSVIHYRMNSSVVGVAMPELARSIVHEKGVELIKEWIDSF